MNKKAMINLNKIPFIIKFYLAFSLIATLFFSIILTFFSNINEKLVPHVGWSPATTYMFSLAISIPILFNKKQDTERIIYRFIYGVIALHIIGIIYGLKSISINEGNNFNNPYLTVGEYRYIWVLVIPIIWISIFVYERFKKVLKSS